MINIKNLSEGQYRRQAQALSAIFGIDIPNDEDRFLHVNDVVIPLIKKSDPKITEKLKQLLPIYEKAWTASGRHRFYPLIVCVNNILAGREVFDLTNLLTLEQDILKYFLHEYKLTFGQKTLPKKIFPNKSDLRIDVPQKKSYRWLDIGSAPKEKGAPTLNGIKKNVNAKLEILGIDTVFPYYELKNDGTLISIKEHGQFVRAGKTLRLAHLDGIDYGNALLDSRFDVTSPKFLNGNKFDFISICMTLHHIQSSKASNSEEAKIILINEQNQTTDIHSPVMSFEQWGVVKKILNKLNLGGILFFDPIDPIPGRDSFQKLTEYNNSDLFFMIQRISKNIFKIYKDHPVPYQPNRDIYKTGRALISGKKFWISDFNFEGISSYIKLSQKKRTKLEQLADQADYLVSLYQSWNKGAYGSYYLARQDVIETKDVFTILKSYLRHVPDDNKEKIKILTSARAFF